MLPLNGDALYQLNLALVVSSVVLGELLWDMTQFETETVILPLSLTFSDLIVLVVTWLKTFRHVKQAYKVGMRASLSTLLLRDGKVINLT